MNPFESLYLWATRPTVSAMDYAALKHRVRDLEIANGALTLALEAGVRQRTELEQRFIKQVDNFMIEIAKELGDHWVETDDRFAHVGVATDDVIARVDKLEANFAHVSAFVRMMVAELEVRVDEVERQLRSGYLERRIKELENPTWRGAVSKMRAWWAS